MYWIFLLISFKGIIGALLQSNTTETEAAAQQLTDLFYRYEECVQIVVDEGSLLDRVPLMIRHPYMGYVSYIVRDFNELLQQNVYSYDVVFLKGPTIQQRRNATCLKQCNRIFLITRYASGVFPFFEDDRLKALRYYPFTEIMLVTAEDPRLTVNHLTYIHRYGLFVFWIESTYFQDFEEEMEFNGITNSLTRQRVLFPFRVNNVAEIKQFIMDYLVHPVVAAGSVFRASHYNCPPYVFTDEEG